MNFKDIAQDKKLHLGAGAVAGAVVSVAGLLVFGFPSEVRLITGVLAAVAAGVGKEVFDSKNPDKHTVDKLDVVYTGVGGVIGSLVALLV